MLQFTPQMRLLLSVRPADFRKGIDALVALCQQRLGEDPFSGTVFAFTNSRRTSVKLLVYDGNGFWLCLNPTLPFLKLNLSKSMTYILKKRLGSLQLNKLFFQCAQVVNSCLTIYRSQLALELPLRFF